MADAENSSKGAADKKRHKNAAGPSNKDGPAASSLSKAKQEPFEGQRFKMGDAGAAGGAGVLSFVAMQFKDPWRTILVGISPGLAILFARSSPVITDWLVERLKNVSLRHTARRASKGCRKFIREQSARLKEPNLSPENRAKIQKSIDDAEAVLTKQLRKASW